MTCFYSCLTDLNLYDSVDCLTLATEVRRGRKLTIVDDGLENNLLGIKVRLQEDGYLAWLKKDDKTNLISDENPYFKTYFSPEEIKQKIPSIIEWMRETMQQKNEYRWGGTLGPNYDCSGLIQAGFSQVGIWLPRDSYQQAEFTQSIVLEELEEGDLIFFATKNPQRVDHVALSLGDGYYIHSSGKTMGRNGIGIDRLDRQYSQFSANYYPYVWGYGRVVKSY